MNYHLLLQKLSLIDLISEFCEIQGIILSFFELIKLAAKKNSWKCNLVFSLNAANISKLFQRCL